MSGTLRAEGGATFSLSCSQEVPKSKDGGIPHT